MAFSKQARRAKIRKRIRGIISGTASRPRLSVYRSNKDIYAQVINDESGTTIVAASSKDYSGSKIEQSKKVGEAIAGLCLENGVNEVSFDRNGYLYHGRVSALATGAREAGLKF